MNSFELTFLVRGDITETRQDQLLEAFDEITVAIDHHGRCTITGQFDGQTAVYAARHAIDQLHRLGHDVVRMQEDLVDRSEIAERVGVSRQAVAHWLTREQGVPFPAPSHTVPGPVWLWGDVVRWLLETRREYDTLGTSWPCQTDHDIINGDLARLCRTDEFRDAMPHLTITVEEAPTGTLFRTESLHARWEAPRATKYRPHVHA